MSIYEKNHHDLIVTAFFPLGDCSAKEDFTFFEILYFEPTKPLVISSTFKLKEMYKEFKIIEFI